MSKVDIEILEALLSGANDNMPWVKPLKLALTELRAARECIMSLKVATNFSSMGPCLCSTCSALYKYDEVTKDG